MTVLQENFESKHLFSTYVLEREIQKKLYISNFKIAQEIMAQLPHFRKDS